MSEIQELSSVGNELVKSCGKLKERKYREERGLFLAEGEKLSIEALRSCFQPKFVFASEKKRSLLQLFPDAAKYIVTDPVLRKISDTETPQGIIAVFKMRREGAEYAPPRKCIVLENMQDPGNFGTILRTAESFGIDSVITVGSAVDKYSPKVLRGSMGSAFRVATRHFETPDALHEYFNQSHIALWAAVLDPDAKKLPDIPKGELRAVAIGNEGAGLSPKLLSIADKKVYIPMTGAAESLNAGVAAGIFMWSMYR